MDCFIPWSFVYLTRPATVDDLKESICAAPRQVISQTSHHVQRIVQHRITSTSDRRSANLKICFAIAFPMRSVVRDIIQNMLMKLAVLKMLYKCINLRVCCCLQSDTQHDINRSYLVSACGNHILSFSLRLSLVCNEMLCSLFLAITRHLNFMCRRFGTVSVPSS